MLCDSKEKPVSPDRHTSTNGDETVSFGHGTTINAPFIDMDFEDNMR